MKQFKNLILAGALVLGLAGFAVSCDKYGDDIDELTSRVGKLETQLTDLQTKIDAGVIVTGVTQTAGGVTIQTSNGTYTITNGEKGEKGEKGDKGDQGEKGQGSVVTLGENGNWFIDGVDTKIPYKGEKGDKGEDGAPGKDGKASVVEIGENGNWFIDGVDTGVKAGADGALSAVWDPETGTLTLKNVEGYEGDYVLNLTAAGVTSVELVASIDGANITNKINFATVTEKENVFGIVDPEDGKTLLPGGLKFTEGAKTQRDVNVIVRVSPVNYALKAEDISFQNGNGETLDWVKVVSVEPYKRLYTRAGEPETGLWKIKVALAKDYVKKDFEAATKVGKKNVLFAVKAQDAVSTYDVAFVYEVPKPLSHLDVVVDNDNDIDYINNRNYGGGYLRGQNYYIFSESFADELNKVFTYKEKEWIDTAYTKLVEGKYKESQDDANGIVVVDNRNNWQAHEAFKGTPITITIPAFEANGTTLAYDKSGRLIPNENIRAMYVTLDYEACAVESAPSEWVSWNSYTYTGLNEVVEGAETEIIIDSDKAINDYIGFRVYAVNYDGTLVDPDGRAFYVKLGTDAPAVDWNKGTVLATTVTPLANPSDPKFTAQNTPSTEATISLTDIAGAARYTVKLLDDKGNETVDKLKFNITLLTSNSSRSFNYNSGSVDKDLKFSEFTKVRATPRQDWSSLGDNKTYTEKLTIYDNVGHALATLTVSMTKVMPTTDPKGAYVFKTDFLEADGVFYPILDDSNAPRYGSLNNVHGLFNQAPYNKVDQSTHYGDPEFENSEINGNDFAYGKLVSGELHVQGSVILSTGPYYFIDGNTKHAVYVDYDYGLITSGDYYDALESEKDENGFYIDNNRNYHVWVKKVDVVYCTPYNHKYSFSWATREQLDIIEGNTTPVYSAKDDKGNYTYPGTLPSGYMDKLEVKYGDDLTVNLNWIYGVSKVDGKYNAALENISDLKLDLLNTDRVSVQTNGVTNELYKVLAQPNTFADDVTLTVVDKERNVTKPVTATLVIKCLDKYNAPYYVSVPFTINPR